MKNLIQSALTAAFTLTVAVAAFSPSPALGAREPQPGDDRGGRRGGGTVSTVGVEQRAEGRVGSVDLATSTITLGSNLTGDRQFIVTASTKLRINGLRATLDQVKVGDRAEIRFSGANRIATKIEIVR